jgi:serine/threonine-protein kinase RsbW
MSTSINYNEINNIMELTIPSDVANVSKIEFLVRQVFDSYCCNENHYGTVLIAVTEAVNNAIVHGNSEDTDKKVFIKFNCDQNRIEVCVEDQGEGFDPGVIPDPTAPENIENMRGRGVFLMKQLSDNICFEKGGRMVKMEFIVN